LRQMKGICKELGQDFDVRLQESLESAELACKPVAEQTAFSPNGA